MLNHEDFEALVVEALQTLPAEIMARLENVALTVEDWPSPTQLAEASVPRGSTLFGLYQGIPLTHRTTAYGMVAPDRITLFRGPLLRAFPHLDALAEQVRRTVVHEIGHYFGMNEAQIAALGY